MAVSADRIRVPSIVGFFNPVARRVQPQTARLPYPPGAARTGPRPRPRWRRCGSQPCRTASGTRDGARRR